MRARNSAWRISVAPPAIIRILSLLAPSIAKNRGQMTHAAEIGIIAGCFAGEKRMHRVMEIIAPLRGQSVSALFAGQQDSRVVQIALRHHVEVASEPFPRKLNLLLKLSQNMQGPKIVDTVNGVEP